MRRGEVWLVSLDPTVGAEIQKTRPCVVVSPPDLLERLRTVLVVPLTSGNRPARFRIATKFQQREGLALPEQIRTVDKTRLERRLGALDEASLAATLEVLRGFFSE